uniref:MMS19 nucleotide excision repair protein n=1 Tax=Glossina morsitans morsitans TaxID=37546 RepID=A0A1B0FQL2_GLOMM
MAPLTAAIIEELLETDIDLEEGVEQIVKDLLTSHYDIGELCEKLQAPLTSTSVERRVQGTLLLTRVLAHLPKDMLSSQQLNVMVEFYAARLKDHHNVIPAVIEGIDALVRMDHMRGIDVVKLLQSFFINTTCQSQLRSDRFKLFNTFQYLSERYVSELKLMSGDFIYGIISSIDGERDPRNLDLIFSFMPGFIATYPLLHLSEEMFEIFACYFPIDFTPSPGDPSSITRDDLSAKLIKCLVASPDFIEWAIPLALEKLESELIVAKCDSLELLYQSALNFPCDRIEAQFETIWLALKAEVFPGSEHKTVVDAALRALSCFLEQAAKAKMSVSHNYQTMLLGTILTHLSDVSQRLFEPSARIAIACLSGDSIFASEKIFGTFLLKLNDSSNPLNNEQCLSVYTIIGKMFKIICSHDPSIYNNLSADLCEQLHRHVGNTLNANDNEDNCNQDLMRAAIIILTESAPLINEENRALIYKVLTKILKLDFLNLTNELRVLIERLGLLQPNELQTKCIDLCICDFATYSTCMFEYFLPLVKQSSFTELIVNLLLQQAFGSYTASEKDKHYVALQALSKLLQYQGKTFVKELQYEKCLIARYVKLAKNVGTFYFPSMFLAEIAVGLSLIIRSLPVAEQYMVATQNLAELNLQETSDIYIAHGLLGFLHKDIRLDDHFERLLDDLTQFSMTSDDFEARDVAHHLLCSFVNKIDYNNNNGKNNLGILKNKIQQLIELTKEEKESAIDILAWFAKGLTMRGCDEAGEILEELVKLLEHPTLAYAACESFNIISSKYPHLHLPIIKFLYKQKYFQMMLTKLRHKLETYCGHHLQAFLYILRATPHAVLKLNIENIGPALYKGLSTTRMPTLRISVDICSSFVQKRDEYFGNHLSVLIPLMDVILELASALDDPKRLVRNAAVRARNSWYLIGAPGTE